MAVIHDLYPNSHIHTLNPTDLHHREIRSIKDPLAIDELSQRIQWIPCWILNPTIWLQDLHLQVIAPRFQQIVHHQILLMIWIPKKTVDRLHLPPHHPAIIVIYALIAPRVSLDRLVYGYIPILILEKNRLCARKMVVAVDSACKVTCGVIYEFISLVDKSRKQTTTHHLSQWVKAIEPALSLTHSLVHYPSTAHCTSPHVVIFFFPVYIFFSLLHPNKCSMEFSLLWWLWECYRPPLRKNRFFCFWDIFIFSLSTILSILRCLTFPAK